MALPTCSVSSTRIRVRRQLRSRDAKVLRAAQHENQEQDVHLARNLSKRTGKHQQESWAEPAIRAARFDGGSRDGLHMLIGQMIQGPSFAFEFKLSGERGRVCQGGLGDFEGHSRENRDFKDGPDNGL
jgi:hypothetical protein